MLKQFVIFICLSSLLMGCGHSLGGSQANLPKMPYKEWQIGGQYPHYFPAKVLYGAMALQSVKQIRPMRIAIRDNENYNTPANWRVPNILSNTLDVNANLPQELFMCWVSFVDQTFYQTRLPISLEARQEMVKPHHYISAINGEEKIGYNNMLILGFAPGGNVTAWLVGVPRQPAIEIAQVTSENLGNNSELCPNPYPNGKITEISDEAKKWLKVHGMPEYWQEKNK